MLAHLGIAQIPIVLISIIISLSFHEAMHGFTAFWLGDRTAADMGRLTINPLKHIDGMTTVLLPLVLIIVGLPPFFVAKPVPFNPNRVRYDEYGAALVGLAGPFTNLVLAFLAAMIVRLLGVDISSGVYNALLIFIEVNVGFLVFNLIPFPPLDGSRLLYAFAPEPLQKLMYQIESAGFLAIIVFMFVIFQFIAGPVISIENGILNLLLG